MLSDDDIQRVAIQCAMKIGRHWNKGRMNTLKMRYFARAIEREARRQALEEAAHACEQQITGSDYHFLATNGRWDLMAQAAVNCADAIRALKEETK